jgi:hypothetical protein
VPDSGSGKFSTISPPSQQPVMIGYFKSGKKFTIFALLQPLDIIGAVKEC